MSSLAYLHQTNILYSRISTKYNADTEDDIVSETEAPLKSIQRIIAPATSQIRTLFLPYKGYKRAFIMKQYREQQARLKVFTRKLLYSVRKVI
jgi:hypothetical protein